MFFTKTKFLEHRIFLYGFFKALKLVDLTDTKKEESIVLSNLEVV